jgi:FAD/FMN-containing dehydrogenase
MISSKRFEVGSLPLASNDALALDTWVKYSLKTLRGFIEYTYLIDLMTLILTQLVFLTGDSNIHLAITAPIYDPYLTAKIEPFVYEWVERVKGSVSAEHGLGFKEKNYISYSKSPEAIGMMMKIKQLFDPKNILNPYKVLPGN